MPTSRLPFHIILNYLTVFHMMNSHGQNGQATWSDDPESGTAEKIEGKFDSEHQSSCQTANPGEEQRINEQLAGSNTPSADPVNLMDWNGPDDPENPHNWPTWKLAYHTTIPALFGFTV
jgi:hypothetical protein